MTRWLLALLALAFAQVGCSRGGAAGGDEADLSTGPPAGDDLAGVDLTGADLARPSADLPPAADLAPAAPTELDCYYGWRTLSGCPAPQLSDAFLAPGCVGTTGVFVVGRYFQHGNQYESKNGWMPHGPTVNGKLGRNTWNWLTPRAACITTSNDATYWTGWEIQLQNPDGQASNKLIVRSSARPTLPSTGSTDPFDPNACLDPGMTQSQAAARLPVGGAMVTLGDLPIRRRARACNTLSGCAPFGASELVTTTPARLQVVSDTVHFALGTKDCGQVGLYDNTVSYNSCAAAGALPDSYVHVAGACLMLWQTVRSAIAGDGSYTQTDYGAVLRY